MTTRTSRQPKAAKVARPRANEVALTVAALRIRRSYPSARNLMLRGALHGRLVGGRWYVLDGDVRRLEAERDAGVLRIR